MAPEAPLYRGAPYALHKRLNPLADLLFAQFNASSALRALPRRCVEKVWANHTVDRLASKHGDEQCRQTNPKSDYRQCDRAHSPTILVATQGVYSLTEYPTSAIRGYYVPRHTWLSYIAYT